MTGKISITQYDAPEFFSFSADNAEKAKEIIARYPAGRQQSAVMPLLTMAQKQSGGWLPQVAMDYVANMLGMAPVRVYEVASFYTMYNLKPTGKHVIEICTTTPCWLRGSGEIVSTCKRKLGINMNETTPDGKFTLTEVECMGACVNAPMAQINDDYYEDLTPELIEKLIDTLKAGSRPEAGSQTGRRGSCAQAGPTSLKERV